MAEGGTSGDEECTVADIGGLLADDTARRILEETRIAARSAEGLSEAADVSKPTIYRRLEDLRACELVREETALDPEGGHHRGRFHTDLARIVVELDEDGFSFELERTEPMADRFTRLVEDM